MTQKSLTVIDTQTGAKKGMFVAPAGVEATINVAIQSIINARHAIAVTASSTGRFAATDSDGIDLGRFDASTDAGRAASEARVAAGPAATSRQITYLRHLVREAQPELRGYASRVVISNAMSAADASLHIEALLTLDCDGHLDR
jgi:hypothetical protein